MPSAGNPFTNQRLAEYTVVSGVGPIVHETRKTMHPVRQFG